MTGQHQTKLSSTSDTLSIHTNWGNFHTARSFWRMMTNYHLLRLHGTHILRVKYSPSGCLQTCSIQPPIAFFSLIKACMFSFYFHKMLNNLRQTCLWGFWHCRTLACTVTTTGRSLYGLLSLTLQVLIKLKTSNMPWLMCWDENLTLLFKHSFMFYCYSWWDETNALFFHV